MFAYGRRLFKGHPMLVPLLAAVAAFSLLLGACGGEDGAATENAEAEAEPREATADAEDLRVIRAWSRALSKGDTVGAARYFAHPSTVQNGGLLVRILTDHDAVTFNESLPCGSRVISASSEGDFTTATFRLMTRPHADCGQGVGGEATTSFQIENGKIVEWRRVDLGPGDGESPDAAPV
jgi:hypothetical protein